VLSLLVEVIEYEPLITMLLGPVVFDTPRTSDKEGVALTIPAISTE